MRGSTTLSAVTAALRDEESETDEQDEAMDDDVCVKINSHKHITLFLLFSLQSEQIDADNPKWQLFEAVTSAGNGSGPPLCEPFWKLPSRRIYPDYYKEIKNPVSLEQIKRKLTNHAYGTVSEVAGDLNIMFENAKKYNIQTSKLYKVLSLGGLKILLLWLFAIQRIFL